MSWWAIAWILALALYAVATIWNDRYEQRYGLITWMAVANAILGIAFLMAWSYPAAAATSWPFIPFLAAASLCVTLWHGSAGYRQVKLEDPGDYLPGEHRTLVQIHALILPFELLLLAPPAVLAIVAALAPHS